MSSVLLLSGGLDSTSIAAWKHPNCCLSIDYGQRAADAERRAAATICEHLSLPFAHIKVDASVVGAGLMNASSDPAVFTPEWWPYRNQLLITLAASWGVTEGMPK